MSSPERAPFERIGERYTVEREIGRGASATVYLARDEIRNESVALKVLRPELAESKAAERFQREIRVTSGLRHPQILPVLDVGESDGRLFFALPYMQDGTLRHRLNVERQLPFRESVSIARSIADALDHAHREGFVHRDIKPENILFNNGQAYLADFGIARALERVLGETSTTTGMVRGTVAYMSPEQASGAHDYDGRSDLFSLGCVLYEMIAGVPAFIGPTPEAILTQRLNHSPRPMQVYRPTVPARLEALVQRAMAIAPADRFRTAADMATALESLETELENPPLVTPDVGRSQETRYQARSALAMLRRRPAVTVVVGVALLAVAAVAVRQLFNDSIALGHRDWVLVGDFEGPRDDPALAVAMRELVTSELNQSKTFGMVSRQQINAVMRQAGIPETTRVDAGIAGQLAFRSSVRAIVVGNIQPIGGDRFSVSLHAMAVDTGRSRNLHSESTTATEDDLVERIGGLARQLRGKLGNAKKDIEATLPLVDAATPSFRAYRTYVDGIMLAQTGDVRASNDRFRDAIRQDTAFAAAWASLGTNFLGARQIDSAQDAFAHALAMPTRLTTAQLYRLRGDMAYAVEHDVPTALRWYDAYLAEFPRSIGGRNNRALHLSSVGRYADAATELRTAIADNPLGPKLVQINLFNLVAMLVSLGSYNEAEEVSRDLTPPFLAGAKLLVAGGRGNWSAVDSLGAVLDSQPATPPLLSLMGTTGRAARLGARGSITAALSRLQSARDASSGSISRLYDRGILLTEEAYGRPHSRRAGLGDGSPGAIMTSALVAAVSGDTLTARRGLVSLSALSARDQRLLGHGPALVRGWIAAAGGRWSEITDSLAGAALAGEHDATVLDRPSSIEVRWLVATAYAERGRLDSAVIHMKNAIQAIGIPAGHLMLRGLVLPAAHDHIADWYSRSGDRSRAVEHWNQVLSLLTHPDASAEPLLKRARRGVASSELRS